MTSLRPLRAASLLLFAMLSGNALLALPRAPEWRIFLAGSDVTGTAMPTESARILLVDAAALAPALGISVRVELTEVAVRDIQNREWRGTAGSLVLFGAAGEIPLPRPLRIENRSVYLPLTTLADLAMLTLEVDPQARIARLDRPASAGAGLPDGWQSLSLPKPKSRHTDTDSEPFGAFGGLRSVLPPGYDDLRLAVGVENVVGADWGADLYGSGSIRGFETRLATHATSGPAGTAFYNGVLGFYQPQGFGLEGGDLFSEIWGLAQGVRFLGPGTGSDSRGRLAFSFYRPRNDAAGQGAQGGNRRGVLTAGDEVKLGSNFLAGGEVASDGSWALRTRYHLGRYALSAYGQRPVGLGLSSGISGAVELPADLNLQAGWNRSGSGSQVIDWNDLTLLVPVRSANIVLNSSRIVSATTRLRTTGLAFAVPWGPFRLRTSYQQRDGELRFGDGPRTSYRQRDLLTTLSYLANSRLRFDLLAVDRWRDRGLPERWQQLTMNLRLRTGTVLQVIATSDGSPYRDPLHLRIEQLLPAGYSIAAEYGRISTFQETTGDVQAPTKRLKVTVRKTFDVPTPPGGGEVLGTVGSVLGPVSAGVPVDLGAYRTATDEQGRFAFRNIGPGSYDLAVSPQGIPANFVAGEPQRIAVAARRQQEVDVPLIPLGVITGEVYLDHNDNGREEEGEGISGVVLRLDDLSTESGPDGIFEFHNVPPGSHRLKIDPDRLPPGSALSIPSAIDVGLPPGGNLPGIRFRLVEKRKPLILQEVGR
jgi:hypothetical protein